MVNAIPLHVLWMGAGLVGLTGQHVIQRVVRGTEEEPEAVLILPLLIRVLTVKGVMKKLWNVTHFVLLRTSGQTGQNGEAALSPVVEVFEVDLELA